MVYRSHAPRPRMSFLGQADALLGDHHAGLEDQQHGDLLQWPHAAPAGPARDLPLDAEPHPRRAAPLPLRVHTGGGPNVLHILLVDHHSCGYLRAIPRGYI